MSVKHSSKRHPRLNGFMDGISSEAMIMSSGDSTTPATPGSDKSEGSQRKTAGRPKHAGRPRAKRWWAWLIAIPAALAAIVAFLANLSAFAGYTTGVIHHFRTVCLANTPVNFDLPPTKSPLQVGKYVDAYGTHKWSQNERLWLVLYAFDRSGSKEVYYPFARLQLDGSSWVANRITVGGSRSTDAEGSIYPLDLVLVDPGADQAISRFMARKGPETGMSDLPKGAKVVKQVMLSRVC